MMKNKKTMSVIGVGARGLKKKNADKKKKKKNQNK